MAHLTSALLLAALIVGGPAAAWAGTISTGSYQLLDHGDGQLGPDYGLRVDSLGEVFSVELGAANVVLDYDSVALTAVITGTLNENTMGGNGGVGPTWTVSYTLSGLTLTAEGFTASGGSGTVTDPFSNVTVLTGELQGGSGPVFVFEADGHRISGDSDTPVARGWLLPTGSTDDWLARAVLLPEPAVAAQIGVALLALGWIARRR